MPGRSPGCAGRDAIYSELGPVLDVENWPDGTGVEFVAVPFPVERAPLTSPDDPKTQGPVAVADLVATQILVTVGGVQKYLGDTRSGARPPTPGTAKMPPLQWPRRAMAGCISRTATTAPVPPGCATSRRCRRSSPTSPRSPGASAGHVDASPRPALAPAQIRWARGIRSHQAGRRHVGA